MKHSSCLCLSLSYAVELAQTMKVRAGNDLPHAKGQVYLDLILMLDSDANYLFRFVSEYHLRSRSGTLGLACCKEVNNVTRVSW